MRFLKVVFLLALTSTVIKAQTISLSPGSLSFQNQAVGTTSAVLSVILTNSGNASLALGSIAATGDFTYGSNCALSADDFNRPDGSLGSNWARADANLGNGFSIQGNQARDAGYADLTASRWVGASNPADQFSQATIVAITGHQRQAVIVRATNSAFTNYAGGMNSYDFSGTGYRVWKVVGNVRTSLAYTSAQNMQVGDVVRLEVQGTTLKLKVNGTQILTATDSAITSGDPGIYAYADQALAPLFDNWSGGALTASLAAGASCNLTSTFTPTSTGTRSGSLTVTDASNNSQSVSLSGFGITDGGPVVALSSSSVTFSPSQLLNTTSSAQPVTLTNIGGAPLTISSIAATTSFGESNNCPLGGVVSGSSDDFNRADSSNLGANWARADANLGAGFRISNNQAADAGYWDLTASRWVGANNPADQFSQATIVAVTGHQRQAVIVRATNSAFTNYAGGMNSYDFSGTGYRIWKVVSNVRTSLAYTSAQSMQVGDVVRLDVEGDTLSLIVNGTPLLTATDYDINSGDPGIFAYADSAIAPLFDNWSGGPLQGTLAPGASCTVNTTFTPTVSGTASGSLSVTDDATNNPQAAGLSGVGTPLASIAVTPANTAVTKGGTQQFAAAGTNADGTTEDLTNIGTWASDASGIASINTTGLASALAPGGAHVSLAFAGITGSTPFTVLPPPLVSIAVTPNNQVINAGHTQQFTASGTFADGSMSDVTNAVSWNSSTPSLASISANGLATGVAGGNVTITAVSGAISGSASLTVNAPALTSVAVSPASASIVVGGTRQLVATGTFTDNSTQDLSSQVTWSVSDGTLAIVNATGNVTGLKVGSLAVQAVDGSLTSSATITVTAAPPPVLATETPVRGGIMSPVTLSGQYFGPLQGASTVNFAGLPVSIQNWSDNQVTFSVPQGVSPGDYSISVTVAGNTSSSLSFTVTEPLLVTPGTMNLLLGETQNLQVLDQTGAELSGVNLTVLDSTIASIQLPVNQGDPTVLQTLLAGTTTINATLGDRTGQAQLTIWDGSLLPNGILPVGTIRWSDPQLGDFGRGILQVVQSVKVDENTPDLYAQDETAITFTNRYAQLRAFDSNGHQKWVFGDQTTNPQLIAADNSGGALNYRSDSSGNSLLSRLAQDGTETWTHPVQGYDEYAVGPDGTIYIVEDYFEQPSQVVALDPSTGNPKFSVTLPMSQEEDINYGPNPDEWANHDFAHPFSCTPGLGPNGSAPAPASVPAAHGSLSIASDGTVYLSLSVTNVVFDGEPCDPGTDPNNPTPLDTTQSTLTYSSTMQILKITPDGSRSTVTVDQTSFSGQNWASPVTRFGAGGGRVIPDGQGHGYLPSTNTIGSLLGGGSVGGHQNIMYSDSGSSYPLPFLMGGDMLVGENGTAFIASCCPDQNPLQVQSINLANGSPNWTYTSQASAVQLNMATADGGVVIQEFNADQTSHLTLLDSSGNPTTLPINNGAAASNSTAAQVLLQARDTSVSAPESKGNARLQFPILFAIKRAEIGARNSRFRHLDPSPMRRQTFSASSYSAPTQQARAASSPIALDSISRDSYLNSPLYVGLSNVAAGVGGGLADVSSSFLAFQASYLFGGGNAQNQNRQSPFDIELVWCTNCRNVPFQAGDNPDKNVSFVYYQDNPQPTSLNQVSPTINLTSDQVKIIQMNAFNSFKVAYAAFNVRLGSGRQGTNTVYVVGQYPAGLNGPSSCGVTFIGSGVLGAPMVSRVFYLPNMQEAQFAVNAQTAQPTQSLLGNIGEGIGNNAAHEVAHELSNKYSGQGLVVGGLDDDSIDTYNELSCSGSTAAWVYTGIGPDNQTPIHWGSNTNQALMKILGPRN